MKKLRIPQAVIYAAACLLAAAGTVCAAEKVVVEGSTTVLPIAQKTAEVFMGNNGDIDISVRGGGSGVGIASLLDGSCDIADSSRAMKDTEYEKAAAKKKDPKSYVVAMDGIAIVVNNSNNITALAKKQVKDIYTGAISDWSAVGGPAGKIVVVSRDSSSGTYEAFGELVLKGEKVRPDALMQASNQAIASIVAKTPGGIGYVGLGYVTDSVKALEIDGIMPNKGTVLSGKYPVSRPLFMYTNGSAKGAVKKYIDFVTGPEGQKIVDEEGFVALE
ncbi:MAG: phosphate ABC transporter substrate-binding protein [Candidatus Omnitrophota bacterium]|jgi:phosphate transport system substrate-binding protein